jgi:plastocyanin
MDMGRTLKFAGRGLCKRNNGFSAPVGSFVRMAAPLRAGTLPFMEPESTDQQQFDEQVNKNGKLALEVIAGVGIVAALVMSLIALMLSGGKTTTTVRMMAATPAAQKLPSSATVMIDHVTRGCHTLAVQGTGTMSPSATLHLAAGGTLHLQNNDVMPHQIIRASGPQPSFVSAAMNHMGARSTVSFPAAGTYSLTTKAGEDYTKGIKTTGPDNTLRIKVVVGAA